jgi:hypothetical protein
MSHAWTYETAASCWSAHRDDPEGLWDAFESAEAFLLDHAPRTPQEAARMIEVLVEQGGDRRTDGRDVDALERVRGFLQRLADGSSSEAPATRKTARGGVSSSLEAPV